MSYIIPIVMLLSLNWDSFIDIAHWYIVGIKRG